MLYGGLMTLAAIELDRAIGAFPFLSMFNSNELWTIMLACGTLGMYVVRDRVLEPGQWIPARRFAVGLTGSLAIASAAAEDVPLVLVCILVLGMHAILPVVLDD